MKNKYLLTFFSLFTSLLIVFSSYANEHQEVLKGASPSWIKNTSYSLSAQKNTNEPTTYLLYEKQVDLSSNVKQQYTRIATKINSEQGIPEVSQITLDYFPLYQSLTLHKLSIIRNGEEIDKLATTEIKQYQNENEMSNNIYQESWTALLVVDDVRVGDILEYSFSYTGSNPILGDKYFGSISLNWVVPVEKLNFRLKTRKEKPVYFRFANSQLKLNESVENDNKFYSLTIKDVKPVHNEDYIPEWNSPFSWLEYSEYKNWQEVSLWASNLYQIDHQLPEDFANLLKSLQAPSQTRTISNITQWIQDNIRYFGIEFGENSHKPSTPSETYTRRWGDCKDKSVLLAAALNSLNIKASPAMVSTSYRKAIGEMLPSPGVFDHVIVNVELNGKYYWVDPTRTNQSGDLTQMSFPNYHLALVPNANSTALVTMNPTNEKQLSAKVEQLEKLIVDEKNTANELKVTTTYSGWKAEEMRHYLKSTNYEQVKRDFLNYYTKLYPGISNETSISFEDSKDANQLVLTESYVINDLFQGSSSKSQLTLTPSSISDYIWLPSIRNRNMPFKSNPPVEVFHKTELVLPEKVNIVWHDGLDKQEISNDWFDYVQKAEQEKSSLTIEHHYNMKQQVIPADEFSDYASEFESLNRQISYRVKLSTSSNARKDRVNSLIKNLMKKDKP